MSFKRQNDTITVQEFISEFKQMIEAKFAPIHKRIDQLETRQKRSVPSHEKPESRRLTYEYCFRKKNIGIIICFTHLHQFIFKDP